MKIRFVRLIVITCSFFTCTYSMAQVNVGVNPPKITWNQIDHQDFQVIFPSDREHEAQRVANLLDYIIHNDSLTLDHPQIKVPIILQNQDIISNGFVSIGPWRSEYNLNPPQFQFAGATPWIDMLTIHEYRHVQQVSNARTGWAGKLLRTVFGQGGWAFYNRAIQPRWFLEGDAVYAETVYTNGGRGRSPDFEREYRALRLTGLDYNYEKASFRSFKDFVPSHYNLGYHVTTYARRQFGTDIWNQVLNDTYSKPGLYRFSKAVRKATGFSTKELYKAAMLDLDQQWKEQDQTVKQLPVESLSGKPSKVFTNYRFPNYLDNNQLLVQKSSLSQIRTIYRIQQGQEEKVFIPGVSLSEHYSTNGNKMVWSEIRFHPRWSNKNYSVIREYDFTTGKLRKVTSKSKLMAPAISFDGKHLCAVESIAEGKVSLVVMDAISGTVSQKVTMDQDEFISFPRWHEDNRTIVVPGRNTSGNFLRSYDIITKTWKELIPSMATTIDRVYPKGKHVFYSGSLTGIQNIYALDISTSEIFQVTDSQFGAFDPAVSPDGSKIAYSEYTANGFKTVEMVLTDALWRQPIKSTSQGSNYYESLLDSETGNILDRIPNKEFQVQRYNYFTKGLLNIHSWYPYIEPATNPREYGIGFFSRNIMSSMSITGQVTYDTQENTWKTVGRLSYGPFFPILDIDVSTGQRESSILLEASDSLSLYVGQWNEHAFAAGVRVPLNITHGSYPSSLTFSSKYRHYIVDYQDPITDRDRDENFGSFDLDMRFSRGQSRALQNIYPRWAQTLQMNYRQTIGNSENQGEIFTITSSLFFPGLMRNHSFFVSGAYQSEEIVNAYRFEDNFIYSRGYDDLPFERIYRVSANYTLPIWYPDIALGSMAFFKRLRGNLFYDYSEGRLLGFDTELRSYGAELLVDFQLIRLAEIGAGVRIGRKIDTNEYFTEFVLTTIRF